MSSLAEVLLGLLAHGVALVVLLAAWLTGLPWTRWLATAPQGRSLGEIAAAALGIAWQSWSVAVLGLAGCISAPAVAAAWFLPAVPGLLLLIRRSFGVVVRPDFPRFTPPEKGAAAVLGVVAACWGLLILAGALHRDFFHDSMWYHLPVPQQWALTGRLLMFPQQLQSVFPLAAEAIYAGLLTVGDEVWCTATYAQWTLLLLAAMAVAAGMGAGLRGVLLALALVPLAWAGQAVLLPMMALNDNLAALFCLLAFLVLLRPVLEGGVPGAREAILAGILIGSATATKLVSGVFWFPGWAAVVMLAVARRDRRAASCLLLGVPVVALLAFLPWALRASLTSGNPFTPLFPSLLPGNQIFAPALETMARNVTFYSLSEDPVLLRRHFRIKWLVLMSEQDLLLLLCPIIAAALAWRDNAAHRIMAVVAISLPLTFLALKGENNLVRFMGIGYPMILPGAAILLEELVRWLRHRAAFLILFAVLLGGSAYTYGQRLHKWTTYRTVMWQGWPELEPEEIARAAAVRDKGRSYVLLNPISLQLPPEAVVLHVNTYYPYYLRRESIWAGEATGPLLPYLWRGLSAEQAAADLDARGVTHVLLQDPGDMDPRIAELAAVGKLRPMETPNEVQLWEVLPGGAPITRDAQTRLYPAHAATTWEAPPIDQADEHDGATWQDR